MLWIYVKYQISFILPLQTFTTSLLSFSFPLNLWSNWQLWCSGNRCPLQYTNPHLHSIPNSPNFLLQSKHLLRSFCSLFYPSKFTYYIAQTISFSATLTAVEVIAGDFSMISSFFYEAFFLNRGCSTCSMMSRGCWWLRYRRRRCIGGRELSFSCFRGLAACSLIILTSMNLQRFLIYQPLQLTLSLTNLPIKLIKVQSMVIGYFFV